MANSQEKVMNRVGPEKQKSTDADDQLYIKKAALQDLRC